MNDGDARHSLRLFPLHTVLYPGGRLPLRIFEPRYVGLVRDCMREGRGFGVTPIRRGGEAGAPAEPWPLGTCAEIVDFDQGRDGLLHILVEGTWRFRLRTYHAAPDGLLRGEVERIEDEAAASLPPEFDQLKTVLQKVLELEADAGGAREQLPIEAPMIVYRLLERLAFPLAVKLEMLESPRLADRIERCHRALLQMMQTRER
ncbi:MAG TPA: LON peptidase substrate-binding domain-containing protein [Gammaproteobacteria bacterium]|nr:LON peptidase substrate-binding domain-containing protein [Gammaproteobacteria bacterium]